jgi:hypothetical protein
MIPDLLRGASQGLPHSGRVALPRSTGAVRSRVRLRARPRAPARARVRVQED